MQLTLLAILFILFAITQILRTRFLTFRLFSSTPFKSNFITRSLRYLETILFFVIVLPLSYLEMLFEAYFCTPKSSQDDCLASDIKKNSRKSVKKLSVTS